MTLTQLASLLAVCSALLTSCSSMESGLATVKEKAFGKDEDQLHLTKANPARFLPESTDADDVRTNPAFQQQRRLLAKNTRSQHQANGMPALELPPLPEGDGTVPEGYGSILPPLDGQDAPASITVDGDTPELPPLPTAEELPEIATNEP